jgi:ADP-ribose pyrophosphatase YjhB (NUDIX family)
MISGTIQYCPICGTAIIEKSHSGRIRPTCPQCEWVYFPDPKVAVAVLIKKGNQVLLVQRRFDPQKGYWTLPSGFIDAGEDPKSAAERECVEETGLKIKEIRLLDVVFSQEHPRGASILILYEAEIQSGKLVPGDDANQAAYFPFDNLPPLAFTSTWQILAKYS